MAAKTDNAIQFLRDLIRFDTSNPPGAELPAATYIAKVLHDEGIEGQVLESAPGRGNVVARLHGDGSQGALLLMSHLDVVPADPELWEHPPFAAEIADGCIWGRGTVDTKQLTAMQLEVLLALKREQTPLARDVVFAATADEEAGGILGMGWLVANHPQLVECQYAINEGGGFGLSVNKQHFYLCQTGEKGVCWMKFTARGNAGHAAMPHRDNAVTKLCTALDRLSKARLPQHRTITVERLVRSLAQSQSFPKSAILTLVLNPVLESAILDRLDGQGGFGPLLRTVLHNTATPTVLQAGQKTNVIPSEATAEVDGRLIPSQTSEDLLREIQPYIGTDLEVQFLARSKPYESDPASPLFDLFEQVLDEQDPGCKVVPYIVPGATDSRFLAERGVKAYGFSPTREEEGWNVLELAHAVNERISTDNVAFGTRVLYEVVRRFCSA